MKVRGAIPVDPKRETVGDIARRFPSPDGQGDIVDWIQRARHRIPPRPSETNDPAYWTRFFEGGTEYRGHTLIARDNVWYHTDGSGTLYTTNTEENARRAIDVLHGD